MKIAVQLYTVREETGKDFVGTLELVSKMGYQGVEFAGYGELSSNELKSHLDRLDLIPVGSHISLQDLETNLDSIITYNKEIGNKNIICPYSDISSIEDTQDLVRRLTIIGEILNNNGMQLHYHNHSHELAEVDGKYLLDYLYDNVDKKYLMAEIDTHWVKRAGLNPTEYIKKYLDRISLLHLKDMYIEGDVVDFAALGDGVMDIKSIIRTGKELNVEWFIVENDNPKPNGISNIETSIKYLTSLN